MFKEIDGLVKNKLSIPKEAKRWIESQFPVIYFKNKAINDGEPIVTTNRKADERGIRIKQFRSNSRLSDVNTEHLEVTLATLAKIEIQLWRVTQSFDSKLYEVFEYSLINLEVLKENKHLKVHWDSTQGCYLSGLKQLQSMGMSLFVHVYRKFDQEFMDKSPLRYIKLPKKFRYADIQHLYQHRKLLEMLQKNGMTQLFEEVFNGKMFDRRTVTKQKLIQHRKVIKENDLGINEITLYVRMFKLNSKVDPRAVKYFDQENHIQALKQSDFVKLQKYLIKQDTRYRYYLDYINMMKDIGTPAESEQTLYPKYLTKAHDEAVKKLEVEKNIPLQKQYQKRIKDILELEYQGDKYAVVVPKEITDISIEGKVLEHCVGNSDYLKRHANGETNILFVRSVEKIDEPLYTVEYKNKKIVQYHGYKNRDSENELHKEVESFLFEEWLPERKDNE